MRARRSLRLRLLIGLVGIWLAGTACADGETIAADDGGDLGSVTVKVRIDGPDGYARPLFETFEVGVATVEFVEQVTAVGETDGVGTVLGTDCENLQAEVPEVRSCEEFIDLVPQRGSPQIAGNLDADGTITVPGSTEPMEITVVAADASDELCEWYEGTTIEPGTTSVEISVVLSCA